MRCSGTGCCQWRFVVSFRVGLKSIVTGTGAAVGTEKDLNEVVSKAKGSLAVLVDRNGSREFIPVKLSDEVKK